MQGTAKGKGMVCVRVVYVCKGRAWTRHAHRSHRTRAAPFFVFLPSLPPPYLGRHCVLALASSKGCRILWGVCVRGRKRAVASSLAV